MSKYVIDSSTLESLGNAVRLKTGARQVLKISQMISLINSISGSSSSDLIFVKSELTEILPNLHFDLMTDEQFIAALEAIFSFILRCDDEGMHVVLESCQTSVDMDNNVEVKADGVTPVIIFVAIPMYTEIQYQEAANNATDPIINSLYSILVGDDENE